MSLSRRTFAWVALAACSAAAPLAAQRREIGRNDPRTQLLGYYAAVMAFTPVGLPDRGGRFVIGGAATYIPSVSEQDRTVGFGGTKTENSNLCSAYPRITASKGFGRVSVELGATPPLKVCGIEANVIDAAVGYRFPMSATWDGMLRASGYRGTIKAAITCNEQAITDQANPTCFGGSVSRDQLTPMAGQLDFILAYQGWQGRRIEPYLAAGVRYERIDLDVNFTRDSAQALAASATVPVPPFEDHERLRGTLARIQLSGGASWNVTRLVRLGGEVLYAPGAVMTVSGHVAILFGRSR